MQKTLQLAMMCSGFAAVTMLSGCKAREMGVVFSPTQARHVDDSWLTAAKACWPELSHSGLSNEAIRKNLADPLHFRSAFSVYASMSDAQILQMVSTSINTAPEADASVLRGAATPYLTRLQAAAGAAVDPQASSNGEPPVDTLCAVHPGTPIGFK